MPPKKGKKGRRKGGDSSDEDVPGIPLPSEASNDTETTGKSSRAEKRANKKNKKKGGQQQRGDSDDDDVDPLAHLNTKAARLGIDDDEEEEEEEKEDSGPTQPAKKLTKKQQRRLAEQARDQARKAALVDAARRRASTKDTLESIGEEEEEGGAAGEEQEEEEEEEEEAQPSKPLSKSQQKKLKREARKQAAIAEVQEASSEPSEEEEDEEEAEDTPMPPAPPTKAEEDEEEDASAATSKSGKSSKGGKKGKKLSKLEQKLARAAEAKAEAEAAAAAAAEAAAAAAAAAAQEEEEEEEDEDEEDQNAEEEESAAASGGAGAGFGSLMDDDDSSDDDSKKKKKKKDKKKDKDKKKKDKKEKKKKKKKKSSDDDGEDDDSEAGEEETKLEEGEDEGDDPDASRFMHDEGWTEERGRAELGGKKETAEEKLKDGKKLSNRDKRKLQKEAEKKARDAEYEKAAMAASREGAQFACSQSAVDPNDANWQNALDVIVPSFSISAHNKLLFDNAQLNIVQGRKYGFVGPNGAGKSTLLKMIASKELRIPPKVDCLYVEQEVVADDTPAYEAVLKADKERWALIEEERALTRALDAGEAAGEGAEDRLGEIYARMEEIGADGAESKARRILFGLGFDPKMQSMKTKHFSGGWRMRISLARALFVEPTLLMLDEPTNHLDLNAVIWLDDYLQKWKKTLLIVSHDQDFLNSVCEDIVHLHELRLEYYRGNYDDFKEMERQKRKQQQKDWEKQEKRIRQLKQSGQSKSKATEEVKKKERVRGARAEKKKANQAVAAGQEAQTATELIKRPRDYVVTIAFPDVDELSPPIIEVLDCEFHYPNGPTILKDMNFGIDLDSRICVVGPNGAGKSTLLKLLTGELTPTTGELKRNQRLRMGIYNQHFVDRLPMSLSPVDYIRQEHNEQTYQSTRNLLGRFGLEGHAHTIPMRDLSGGQKARVVFTELSLQHAHILFLDEPTNNLDIESIDALCTAIQNFNGGVVVVTHDARLVEACDCRLWVVDDGGCWAFNGEFEDYKAQLLNDLERKIQAEEERRAAQQAQRRLKAGGGSSRKAA